MKNFDSTTFWAMLIVGIGMFSAGLVIIAYNSGPGYAAALDDCDLRGGMMVHFKYDPPICFKKDAIIITK